MKNKEVIEQLKKLKSFHNGSYGEAINCAIEALNRDGTIPYENGESTVCVCPVCGSVWNIKEA